MVSATSILFHFFWFFYKLFFFAFLINYILFIIFLVPPQKFEFHFIELSRDKIALECQAQGVNPRPLITFSEQHSTNHSFQHRYPPVNVSVSYQPESGLYSASFRHPMHSVLSAGTIYECRLELPGTFYSRKKRIKIIFPTSEYTTFTHWWERKVQVCPLLTFGIMSFLSVANTWDSLYISVLAKLFWLYIR